MNNNIQECLDATVKNIIENHLQIIDDWCKAYISQRYKEGKSIDIGSFTLCQQNLSFAPNEIGHKYWFEDGKPSYPSYEGWIKSSDRLPKKFGYYLTYNENHHFCSKYASHQILKYRPKEKIWWWYPGIKEEEIIHNVTHWMDLPSPPDVDNESN
jgi:Protein of unknown function (DUF551)